MRALLLVAIFAASSPGRAQGARDTLYLDGDEYVRVVTREGAQFGGRYKWVGQPPVAMLVGDNAIPAIDIDSLWVGQSSSLTYGILAASVAAILTIPIGVSYCQDPGAGLISPPCDRLGKILPISLGAAAVGAVAGVWLSKRFRTWNLRYVRQR